MRNEQRLFIQLVVAMAGAMLQGSVFVFALFSPSLKSAPFNFTETQVNFVASISAICNYFAFPGGLFYDRFGSRATLIGAMIILTGCWFSLHFFVFQDGANWLSNYEENNNSTSKDNNDQNPDYYSPNLALITILFSLLFSQTPWIEMSVLVGGLSAFRHHHGFFVTICKCMIGIGSSAMSLTQNAFFVTDDADDRARMSGNFCFFLGCYAAIVTGVAALLTSHPMEDLNALEEDEETEEETEEQTGEKQEETTDYGTSPLLLSPTTTTTSTSSSLSLRVMSPKEGNITNNDDEDEDDDNDDEKGALLPSANRKSESSSTVTKRRKITPSYSFIAKIWDIRCIGINSIPPKVQQSSSTSSPPPPSLQDYQDSYKTVMKNGLLLLLACFILVVCGNAVELAASKSLPKWVFILVAISVLSIPLYFLSLQYWLPGLKYLTSRDGVEKHEENRQALLKQKTLSSLSKEERYLYSYKTEEEKPYRIKLVEKIAKQMFFVDEDFNKDDDGTNNNNSGSLVRKLKLLDFEGDYSELSPPNSDTICANLCFHPVDIAALWLLFFSLMGVTVMIYSNLYSIYYALQGEFTYSSARNAVFVSIFGICNAAGRAAAGLSLPLLQGRARAVWRILPVAPLLQICGLLLFLVVRGAMLALPFSICGLSTGFLWGQLIVFSKRTFAFSGSFYAAMYSAGSAGIVAFNLGLFSYFYEHEASKQHTETIGKNQTQTHRHNQNNQQPESSRHCIGLNCIEDAIWIAIAANCVSLVCAKFVIYRLERGSVDTDLRKMDQEGNNSRSGRSNVEDMVVLP